MRGQRPVLMCDAEDSMCGDWEIDHYAETVTRVGGVLITRENRAPGWVSTNLHDYCPEHASEATP